MKKLLVLLGIIAMLAVACGGAQTAKPEAGAGTKAAVDNSEAAKALLGEWVCEAIGDVLPQYKIGLPSALTVNADGTYVHSMTINGVLVTAKGTYTVDTSKKPAWIDFKQTHILGKDGNWVEKAVVAAGIWEIKDGKLSTIFYNKAFFPRAEELGGSDTQVFKKK